MPIAVGPCTNPDDLSKIPETMRTNTRGIILHADGIDCAGCAGDMENILRATAGIIDASVNFADETIYVKYDSQVHDRKNIFSAVRRLGYKVAIIREE
jgi:Cu+-exporting ATPase